MVVTTVMDPDTFSGAPTKLRRSRRLSSTRGLLRSNVTQNSSTSSNHKIVPQHQNFKPKLTSSLANEAMSDKIINWELNERISLSSSSSMGIEIRPDTTKGIGISDRRKTEQENSKDSPKANLVSSVAHRPKESSRAISKQTLELLNVSGFSPTDKHRKIYSSRSTNVDVFRDPSNVDGNVIKSDSKYEIGIPGECTMLRKKKKQSRPSCHQVTTKSMSLKNDRNDLTGTSVRRRWEISKDNVDKTNDSITKRLELIHELNQKILANYERFQQKSKRPYGKNSSDVDAKGSPKNSLGKKDVEASRRVLSDLKDSPGNKEHIYSEIGPKRKTKISTSRQVAEKSSCRRIQEEDSNTTGNSVTSKERQFNDRATRSTQERLESVQNKSKSSVSRALRNFSSGGTSSKSSKKPSGQSSNENFSLAAKPEFHVETNIPTGGQCESPIKKLRSKFEEAPSYGKQTPAAFHAKHNHQQSNDDSRRRCLNKIDSAGTNVEVECLENSRLYPEPSKHVFRGSVEMKEEEKQPSAVDEKRFEISETNCVVRVCVETEKVQRNEEHDVTFEENVGKIDNQSKSMESKRQEILEKEILDNLNETIGRFDNEDGIENDRIMETYVDETESRDGGSESFSTDSIQSTSPTSKLKSSPVLGENTCLQETFNSSWDSGVGVDVGTGNGWVRIHTGIESSLVYLTLDTTVKDICRDMLLGEDLSLFMQYGGEPSRRMAPHERPLEYQDEFLKQLGYQEISRRARLGVDPELRHLIAFHVGPAAPQPDLTGYSRCGYALVLKGLVFPQWKRRSLAVIGSRLFLYPSCPDSRPEWMELGGGGGAVCYAPSRLGKLVLRITGFPRISNREQQHERQQLESHHQETRHLYLGFQHPWDRDLWRGWLKQVDADQPKVQL